MPGRHESTPRMHDTLPPPVSRIRSRLGSIALLGLLCVLLQQITIQYETQLLGLRVPGSLIHLHAGLLFAIAMLAHDRWVYHGVTFIAYAAWVGQRFLESGDYPMLFWSSVAWLLFWAWTLSCARLAGWPRASGEDRLYRRDLFPFVVHGLLLYPLGLALLGASLILLDSPANAMNAALQSLFAKQFGVAIVVLPLVAAWGERGQARWQRPLRRRDLLSFSMLCVGLALCLWATWRVRGSLSPEFDLASVLMDYRFALMAILLWCVLRLPTRHAMAALSLTLFCLIHATAGAAMRTSTGIDFLGLLHIALEVSVLLVTMTYLWVISRDRQELSVRLSEETLRDTVTGLRNLKALREQTARHPARRAELGYLLLDQSDSLVTGFGLETQASAMRAVAARLDDLVQPFYVGAGQFALLPRQGGGDDLWEKVMARVEHAEIDVGGQAVRLLPYLGVASLPSTRMPVDAALLAASHLAYEARQFGEVRPRYSEAGDAVSRDTRRRHMQDATAALACLRGERVELYFQPIRALGGAAGTEGPQGLRGEVLCRLRDEQGELIAPARFLGPIEAAGRGTELDLAVLRALFRLLRKHPAALPHCRQIAINLTGQSLASTSFQVELRTLLADSPLPLSALCFEVTETAAISSTASASQLLTDLRAKGCRIAIDDFGTGMQSFVRLKELPVDIIKIDGSFIRNVTQRGKDHALVQASVAVAEAFGAETVAEFVEDEETADCLREMGVQWMQGHLYSPPLPLAAMLAETAAQAGTVRA